MSRGTHCSPSRLHRLHESEKRAPHATLAEWQELQARLRGSSRSEEHSRLRRRQRAQGRVSAHAVLDARQCRHACSSARLWSDFKSPSAGINSVASSSEGSDVLWTDGAREGEGGRGK